MSTATLMSADVKEIKLIQFIFTIVMGAASQAQERIREWKNFSDEQLVKAIIDGDNDAFTWLVKRYWKSMQRVVMGIVRDEMASQEVVQDVWLTIHKEIKNFRMESSLKNWMFRILTNRAHRVSKKESKSVAFSQISRNDGTADVEPVDEFTKGGKWKSPVHNWRNWDPQAQAINSQGLQLLSKFIETLPKAQQAVITMRDIEGLDASDVCQFLDMTVANQRVLLHRARTTLRQQLEAAEREEN